MAQPRTITELYLQASIVDNILNIIRAIDSPVQGPEIVVYYAWTNELVFSQFGLQVPIRVNRQRAGNIGAVEVSGKATIPYNAIVAVFEYEDEDGQSTHIGFSAGASKD